MHRSASPRPGYRPSSRSGSLANTTPLSPRLGIKPDRSRDASPALNFLARRGSEATHDDESDFDTHDPFVVVDADEAMANAERDLKADAEWKRIQQNTFTRWANEHLKQAEKQISNLETELSDGLKLISLIEVLSGKRMPKHNKKPTFRSQKLENVSIALQFLEREGITLVNIDSTDIVDCKLKLILGLIWTLILHYAISMPMWDGPTLGGGGEEKTPKQRLLGWVKDKLPELPVNNFTTDWNSGKAVGALVDSVAPGLCPDWEDWDPTHPLENAREAMDLADQWLNVPKLLTPEDIVNPNLDEQSMMTYLSQFPNAKLKPGAPLRQKTNPSKVRAYGPGLEPKGLVAKAPAKFTVETFGAGDGEVVVEVTGPNGNQVKCDVVFNNDRRQTYSCSYFPEDEGDYVVTIKFATRQIPKSPYNVNVEGFAGDASKVTASGPGLEPEGVIINRPTYFDIYCEGAGKGNAEVIILDPKGKKDSAPVKVSPHPVQQDVYRCEYIATMLGMHSINVFYAGNPIPDSPFGVKVAPVSQPNKVWANGRGLQSNGIRVNETVDFKVYTEGAGEGVVGVKIIGPGGKDVHATSRKLDSHIVEYTYTPQFEGRHIIMITFANQEIPRSPFEVNIGPHKTSKIKAYGPGLKGGIVNKPAVFTVDTCGETGSLGFSIQGPSQAKISCKDNSDGTADIEYLPTEVGEYAVHVLCDKEDIPGSPYMAQIIPGGDFFPDKVKVFGPGVENGVNPKEKTYFTIDTTEAGKATLEVLIMDALGQFEPEVKEKSEGIFECTYTVRKGMHKQTIMVNFGGVAVPGSPFHVTNNNPNDPSKVEVYGPGVEKGVQVGVPVDFTVDCKKSGPGDVRVKIESSKRKNVPVSITDNGDDTYKVNYEAQDHGPQTITITLDDEEIPQSPIKLDIKKQIDLSKIKIIDLDNRAFVDCVNDFYIDLSGLPLPDQKSTLNVDIKGPDGKPVDSQIKRPTSDGPYQVIYTPTDEGEHEIDIEYSGLPLPDTPFPVIAERGFDPSKVKASGEGLEKGFVDETNSFDIETKNAGTGELGISVEGPDEAEITCINNNDGTCTVNYIPVEEGDYDVNVKFCDEHIPGSPFKVPVTTRDGKPKADARKVAAYGTGLDPDKVFEGKPAVFTIDSTATADAPIEVEVTANGRSVGKKPVLTKKGIGLHDVTYVPPPVETPYDISVKYGGLDIPGSPFQLTANPNQEGAEDDGFYRNGTGLQRKKQSDASQGKSIGPTEDEDSFEGASRGSTKMDDGLRRGSLRPQPHGQTNQDPNGKDLGKDPKRSGLGQDKNSPGGHEKGPYGSDRKGSKTLGSSDDDLGDENDPRKFGQGRRQTGSDDTDSSGSEKDSNSRAKKSSNPNKGEPGTSNRRGSNWTTDDSKGYEEDDSDEGDDGKPGKTRTGSKSNLKGDNDPNGSRRKDSNLGRDGSNSDDNDPYGSNKDKKKPGQGDGRRGGEGDPHDSKAIRKQNSRDGFFGDGSDKDGKDSNDPNKSRLGDQGIPSVKKSGLGHQGGDRDSSRRSSEQGDPNGSQNQRGKEGLGGDGTGKHGAKSDDPYRGGKHGSGDESSYPKGQAGSSDNSLYGPGKHGADGNRPHGSNRPGSEDDSPYGNRRDGSRDESSYGPGRHGSNSNRAHGSNRPGSEDDGPYGNRRDGSRDESQYGPGKHGADTDRPGSGNNSPYGNRRDGSRDESRHGPGRQGAGIERLGSGDDNPYGNRRDGSRDESRFGSSRHGIASDEPQRSGKHGLGEDSPYQSGRDGSRGDSHHGPGRYGAESDKPYGTGNDQSRDGNRFTTGKDRPYDDDHHGSGRYGGDNDEPYGSNRHKQGNDSPYRAGKGGSRDESGYGPGRYGADRDGGKSPNGQGKSFEGRDGLGRHGSVSGSGGYGPGNDDLGQDRTQGLGSRGGSPDEFGRHRSGSGNPREAGRHRSGSGSPQGLGSDSPFGSGRDGKRGSFGNDGEDSGYPNRRPHGFDDSEGDRNSPFRPSRDDGTSDRGGRGPGSIDASNNGRRSHGSGRYDPLHQDSSRYGSGLDDQSPNKRDGYPGQGYSPYGGSKDGNKFGSRKNSNDSEDGPENRKPSYGRGGLDSRDKRGSLFGSQGNDDGQFRPNKKNSQDTESGRGGHSGKPFSRMDSQGDNSRRRGSGGNLSSGNSSDDNDSTNRGHRLSSDKGREGSRINPTDSDRSGKHGKNLSNDPEDGYLRPSKKNSQEVKSDRVGQSSKPFTRTDSRGGNNRRRGSGNGASSGNSSDDNDFGNRGHRLSSDKGRDGSRNNPLDKDRSGKHSKNSNRKEDSPLGSLNDDDIYSQGPDGKKLFKRGSSSSLLHPTSPDEDKYGRARDHERDAHGPFFRPSDNQDRFGKDPYGKQGRGGSHDDSNLFPPLELNGIPLPPGAKGRIGDRVEAEVKTPSGFIDIPKVVDSGKGSIGIGYQPTEAGPHTLNVKYDGENVQGSPFKFHATPMDGQSVVAYGPGLTHGVCGDPSKFVISTEGAGAGGLALAVVGPSKAEINCLDNKDGTVDVSFVPTAPGEYKITAKFADKHIEGSPFTCKVTGEGTKKNTISVGSSADMSLPEVLSNYDLRTLQTSITSPSGIEEPCFLKKLPNGINGVSFTPREAGEHQVSVKRNGQDIQNSPFKIFIKEEEVGDASKVKATGPGLTHGKTQQDNIFNVDTKNAGYGGLSLSIEGPSKAKMNCKDNEDGTLDVMYNPSEPGLYLINLKYADQFIPGSPFAVAVSGEGLKKQTGKADHLREAVPITEVGSQCRLTFKMPGINGLDLRASVLSPSGKVEKAVTTEVEDGLFSVNFVPYELGIHTVVVNYKDIDIPGSPFQFTVGPLQDGGAHRVHAGGPGLERGIQGQPCDFDVWTREAGEGSMSIHVEGPGKAEVDIQDRKDGSCHVSYVVDEPGEYSIGIRFNDTLIPGSPSKVCILPSAEKAERIRISNITDLPVAQDVPQTMLLNMNGADGDVECKVIAPSGYVDDCFITPLGDGEHSVRFIPKEEGIHYLHAKLNGVHIPGSPFKLSVEPLQSGQANDDPSTVTVTGVGIEAGTTGKSSSFVIDTSGVGAGTLCITVDGPSKVDLSCNEVDEGYEVHYTPLVPGKYFVTVKYNGKNVKGSPFCVNIGGENLSSTGLIGTRNALQSEDEQRSSSMTMTMQRTSYTRHQYSEQRASSISVSRSSTRPITTLNSDASRVSCQGSGLEHASINRSNTFYVDSSKAGHNCLFVGVLGPEIPCEEILIKHRGGHRYSVDYVVKDKGNYVIIVKWGDEHVPGSPFHIKA